MIIDIVDGKHRILVMGSLLAGIARLTTCNAGVHRLTATDGDDATPRPSQSHAEPLAIFRIATWNAALRLWIKSVDRIGGKPTCIRVAE
jgi:hypothetical protein